MKKADKPIYISTSVKSSECYSCCLGSLHGCTLCFSESYRGFTSSIDGSGDDYICLYRVNLQTKKEEVFRIYEDFGHRHLSIHRGNITPNFVDQNYKSYGICLRGLSLSAQNPEQGWAVLHSENSDYSIHSEVDDELEWQLIKFNLDTLEIKSQPLPFKCTQPLKTEGLPDLDHIQSARGFFMSPDEDKIILIGSENLYWFDSETLQLVDKVSIFSDKEHYDQWVWFGDNQELFLHLEAGLYGEPDFDLRGEMVLMVFRFENQRLVLKETLQQVDETETLFAARAADGQIILLQYEKSQSYDGIKVWDYLVVRKYCPQNQSWQVIAKTKDMLFAPQGYQQNIQALDKEHVLILTKEGQEGQEGMAVYRLCLSTAELTLCWQADHQEGYSWDSLLNEDYLFLVNLKAYALQP